MYGKVGGGKTGSVSEEEKRQWRVYHDRLSVVLLTSVINQYVYLCLFHM